MTTNDSSAADTGLTTTIERLKASKQSYTDREDERGFRNGVKAAKDDLEYDDFLILEKLHDAADGLGRVIAEHLDADPESLWGEDDHGRAVEPSDVYARAWLRGVLSIWAEVRDTVADGSE